MVIRFPPKRMRKGFTLLFFCSLLLLTANTMTAQATVTGAFEGIVSDSQTGLPLRGAALPRLKRELVEILKSHQEQATTFHRER